jgi:MFS family permease
MQHLCAPAALSGGITPIFSAHPKLPRSIVLALVTPKVVVASRVLASPTFGELQLNTSVVSRRPLSGSLLAVVRRSRNKAVSGSYHGSDQPHVNRALGLSIIDGVLFALMVGASESYFGACAIALGHTDAALAMLATLPLVAGALAQAFTGPLVLLLGSRKRVVVTGALLQAASHLGLIAVAWSGSHAFGLLLALVIMYFVSGMMIAPAWGAWMGGLTENVDRQRYFAVRSGCVSASMVVAFLWAGYHLRDAAESHRVSQTYAMLFSIGLIARLLSVSVLIAQPDPTAQPEDSLKRVLARTRAAVRGDGFRLAFGLGVLVLGAQISIPFYAPYMLKTLQLDYGGFARMVAVQLVARALVFPFAHRVAAKIGLQRMLVVAIANIALVAWIWGATSSMPALWLAQFLSGIAWACYEFASFQLLLHSGQASHRVEFLAVAASLAGIMQLSGALLGSWLITHLGLSYRGVFLVSAVARCLPLFLFMPMLYERPTLYDKKDTQDIARTPSLAPVAPMHE